MTYRPPPQHEIQGRYELSAAMARLVAALMEVTGWPVDRAVMEARALSGRL